MSLSYSTYTNGGLGSAAAFGTNAYGGEHQTNIPGGNLINVHPPPVCGGGRRRKRKGNKSGKKSYKNKRKTTRNKNTFKNIYKW